MQGTVAANADMVNPNSTQKLVQQRFKQLKLSQSRDVDDSNQHQSMLDKLQDTRFLQFKVDQDRKKDVLKININRPPTGNKDLMQATMGTRIEDPTRNRKLMSNASTSKLITRPQDLQGQVNTMEARIRQLSAERSQRFNESGEMQQRRIIGDNQQLSESKDWNRINNPSYASEIGMMNNTQKLLSRKNQNQFMRMEEDKSPRSALLQTSSKLSLGKRDDLGMSTFLGPKPMMSTTSKVSKGIPLSSKIGQNTSSKEGLIKNRNNSFITYKHQMIEKSMYTNPRPGAHYQPDSQSRLTDNSKILIQQPDSSNNISLVSGITSQNKMALNGGKISHSEIYQAEGKSLKKRSQNFKSQAHESMTTPIGQITFAERNDQQYINGEDQMNMQIQNQEPVRSFITNSKYSQPESGDKISTQSASISENKLNAARRDRKASSGRKKKSRSRSKSGTSVVREKLQPVIIADDSSISTKSKVKMVQNHLNSLQQDPQDPFKVQSNTQVFQDLLIQTAQLQKEMVTKFEEHNCRVKLHFDNISRTKQISSDEMDKLVNLMIDMEQYPLVDKKSRSFKEIAQGLVGQFRFLLHFDLIKLQSIPSTDQSIDNNSISNDMAGHQMDPVNNLKFKNSNDSGNGKFIKPDQKIISLSYLQEIQSRDNQIEQYRQQVNQLMDTNNRLKLELGQLTQQHDHDRQVFKEQIGRDHFDMERNIDQIKMEHSERINILNQQMEQMTLRKNEELQKYVQEVRACQSEIKKLHQEREKRRQSIGSDPNQYMSIDDSSKQGDFQHFGQKNMAEMQAELEYFIEKAQSLETELKTLNLELLYHRTEKEDTQALKSTLEATEQEVRNQRNKIKDLTKLKEHFEKEYIIQKAQLDKQENRIHEALQNNQVVSSQEIQNSHNLRPSLQGSEEPPAPRDYGAKPMTETKMDMNYMNSIKNSNEKSVEREYKSRNRSRSFGNRSREYIRMNQSNQNNQMMSRGTHQDLFDKFSSDKKKTMQSQAAMVEKLLAKIKKLESMKLKQDFPGIFNLDKQEEKKPFLGNDLELKTYKAHIAELYELLLKQNGNKLKNVKADHEEQFVQIKSYLNLQAQMGTLKKFRFDQGFADIMQFSELQDIHDLFFNKKEKRIELGELSNLNTKSLYMNAEQQLQIKNDCFEKLYRIVSDHIGQFFLIYSQMQYQRDKNQSLLEKIKSIEQNKEQQFLEIEQTGPDQFNTQRYYKLRDFLEQERASCKRMDLENQRFQQQVQDLTQQLEFHKQFNELDPGVAMHLLKFITDFDLSEVVRNQDNGSGQKKSASKFGGKNRSLSRKQGKSKSKIFGGKKTWLKREDNGMPLDLDLNEAIDKIEYLQKQLDEIEQENQLLAADNKTHLHEINQMESAMKAEAVTRQEMESGNLTLQSSHTALKNEFEICNQRMQEAEKKVERLSALNQELRDLIEEEREANIEEIQRLMKENERKIKQVETRSVILKNKLTHLASLSKVYIQQTFTHEQIVDAILDQNGPQRLRQKSNQGSTYRLDNNSTSMSQNDLIKQRMGMQSSLSEMQQRKRKIKIDYRKKEIQEEFVNNSDCDKDRHVGNARTMSRNNISQSQKQISHHMTTKSHDKSRNRYQDYKVSQERPQTHQNIRKNAQAYKTLDPSEAYSQSQGAYQEYDLPSQIHHRNQTQVKCSHMRRRDQKGGLDSEALIDGNTSQKKEEEEIRSRSKRRLDQMFQQYENDVQLMNNQQATHRSTAVEASWGTNEKVQSQRKKSIVNEEQRSIKVFRPSHSRSKSRTRNQIRNRSLSRSSHGHNNLQIPSHIDNGVENISRSSDSNKPVTNPSLPITQTILSKTSSRSQSNSGRKDAYEGFIERNENRQLRNHDLDNNGMKQVRQNMNSMDGRKVPDSSQSLSEQIQEDIKRNLAVQNQFCKERQDFSNKLQALRDRMNNESGTYSNKYDSDGSNPHKDTPSKSDYYKIKSPVKKPNLSKKKSSKNFKSNLIDMSASKYNPEDSIGKRLREFEVWQMGDARK